MMKLPKFVLTCLQLLNQQGYESYVVGGAVRDMLLNLDVNDFDITTNATPQQVKTCFSDYKIIDTGIHHGTVTVIIDNNPIEITTYRTETTYSDFRHPDQVVYSKKLPDDCKRRDFTINALCYNPVNGLIDFFNGQEDLHNKIIRCIGNSNERFTEDALRILRAIRFSAQLNFTIEPNTRKALSTCKEYLKHVSSERIVYEINKIFLSPTCANQCFMYQHIFEVFIPELNQLNYYPEKKNKTYGALSESYPSFPIRFAILIHKCNEPDLLLNASQIMNRLKFSNILKLRVNTLLSSINMNLNTKVEIKFFLQRCKIDFMNICEFRQCIDSTFNIDYVQQLYNEIISNNECYSLKQLAITGHDLKNLGYQNTSLSFILNDVLNNVIQGKLNNNKEDILKYLKSNLHE